MLPTPRLARTLAVLALAANAYALFDPDPGGPALFPHADKVIHTLIFWVPTALAVLGRWPVPWVAGGMLAYAAASEITQAALLPHRSGSWGDLLCDALGVGLGVMAGLRARHYVYAPDAVVRMPARRDT